MNLNKHIDENAYKKAWRKIVMKKRGLSDDNNNDKTADDVADNANNTSLVLPPLVQNDKFPDNDMQKCYQDIIQSDDFKDLLKKRTAPDSIMVTNNLDVKIIHTYCFAAAAILWMAKQSPLVGIVAQLDFRAAIFAATASYFGPNVATELVKKLDPVIGDGTPLP